MKPRTDVEIVCLVSILFRVDEGLVSIITANGSGRNWSTTNYPMTLEIVFKLQIEGKLSRLAWSRPEFFRSGSTLVTLNSWNSFRE